MKFKINAYEAIYVGISIATFSHSSWAASTVLEGPMPLDEEVIPLLYWYVSGWLLAAAIDLGLLVTARQLAKHRNWVLLLAFVVAALASFYTQVLYGLSHVGMFNFGTGVTRYWFDSLTPLVDARVILVPLMLPLFAVIYTAARIKEATDQEIQTQGNTTNTLTIHTQPYQEQQSHKADLQVEVRKEKAGQPPLPAPSSDLHRALPSVLPQSEEHEHKPEDIEEDHDDQTITPPQPVNLPDETTAPDTNFTRALRGEYVDPRPENWEEMTAGAKRAWRSAQRKKR